MFEEARPRASGAVGLPLVLAAAALLLFAGLGRTDFWPPDEPRHGAIAEELRSLVHGWRGLWLLHLNGDVYNQKPPLFYWLAAFAGSFVGRVTETAARLPSAAAAWCTVGLVCWLGRLMFTPRAGVLAGAVLLTVPSFVRMGRSARLDALLTVFVTLAFVAAWRLDRRLGSERANRWWLHASIGLGVLTKGPVAALFPLIGLLAYLAWEGRLRELSRFVSLPSLLASLGPGLVWLAGAAALGPSGFSTELVWDTVVVGFLSGTRHAKPWWFYLGSLPRSFLPWTLLWPLCWVRYRALHRDPTGPEAAHAWRFLLASIGAAFVFFSVSSGKRGIYLLPIQPLIALACADGLASWLDGGGVARWVRTALLALASALALAALGTLVFDRVAETQVPATFGLAVAASLIGAVFVERRIRQSAGPRVALASAAIFALAAAELAVFVFLFPALNPRNSPRTIAVAAAAATPEGAEVGLFRNAHLTGPILYYGERRVRPLRDPAGVARFVATGGRTIVVEDEDLPLLGPASDFRVLAQASSRQRRLLVVAPADAHGSASATLR